MSSVLEIENITKIYGKKEALKDLNIKLNDNKIYGLLGRNGAGKTTLLNLITNKICATSGQIRYMNENVWENEKAQRNICYMSEKNMFPKDIKVKEIFETAKLFYPDFNMEYALKLAATFKIDLKKKFKSLSKGYESMVKIVIALASNAPLVILDEPVLGLDAAVRDVFYQVLVEDFAENPRTFIISTHLIEEISDLIEEAIIIKDGTLLFQKPVEEILQMGYCVAGKAVNVDNYTKGRKVIHEDLVGNFKTATIFESDDKKDTLMAKELEVDIVPMQLQKLFVHLTAE